LRAPPHSDFITDFFSPASLGGNSGVAVSTRYRKDSGKASRFGLSFYNFALYLSCRAKRFVVATAPTVGFRLTGFKGTALASVIGFVELTKVAPC